MRNVLITGGATGIGKATVEAFCAQGDKVFFTYCTHKKEGEELALKTGAKAVYCDLRDEKQIEALALELQQVDVLVNNAAVSSIKQIQDVELSEWREIFSVNLEAAFLLIKKYLPYMLSRRSGRIVSIGSMWGQVGASCESVYSASKAALIGFSKALAKELGLSGITVNVVAPGVIDTQMNRFDKTVMDALIEETPVGKIGTPQDVARCIVFLAEEASSFITGQVLSVNGGFVV